MTTPQGLESTSNYNLEERMHPGQNDSWAQGFARICWRRSEWSINCRAKGASIFFIRSWGRKRKPTVLAALVQCLRRAQAHAQAHP
mmetsp:Transcript_677/g.1395  ORF Transcript_677/g.1395 Transcript_677/m.1395 type:complete len:86 (-) Transcript_677:2717-2974(-)